MNIKESIFLIQETIDEILLVSEGMPEEVVRWKPADDQWSILEVLCHVEEATPYWLKEIQAVVASPGIEWGRGLQHEGRLAAVAQARERSLQEVLQHIGNEKENVRHILASLSESDLQRESPSRNPRFGVTRLAFIVEHMLVEHLTTHLKQINRNIQRLDAANQTI